MIMKTKKDLTIYDVENWAKQVEKFSPRQLTEEEAKALIEKHKDDDILTSLIYEEWEVGKTIYD